MHIRGNFSLSEYSIVYIGEFRAFFALHILDMSTILSNFKKEITVHATIIDMNTLLREYHFEFYGSDSKFFSKLAYHRISNRFSIFYMSCRKGEISIEMSCIESFWEEYLLIFISYNSKNSSMNGRMSHAREYKR